jgi:prepilin-type N-terminal cleavage/methylation domain-containing protein/prepilin-type processing-associated H-X9-DG protein
MARLSRHAFTLVELLVVIAIIGILMALLVPAVNAARERARNLQCQNNLKNIGAAFLAHMEHQGYLPTGGWGTRWTGDPDRPLGKHQPGGWTFSILPYIEQEALFNLGRDDKPKDITPAQQAGAAERETYPVAIFICPTRRRADLFPRPAAPTYINGGTVDRAGGVDYAANAGDLAPAFYDGPASISAADSFDWNMSLAQEATGIAFPRSELTTANIRDGNSSTYLVGEKYIQPENYVTGLAVGDDSGMYEGYGPDLYRWAHARPLPDRRGVAADEIFGGPHSGTFNVVFCDGNVRGVNYSVDLVTHARLANRKDGQAIDPTKF